MKKSQKSKIFESRKNIIFSRRAQSISINTIVVAAIALVVMVLLILIFTNSIGGFRVQSGSCYSVQGQCIDREDLSELCNQRDYKATSNHPCYKGQDIDPDKVCCINV